MVSSKQGVKEAEDRTNAYMREGWFNRLEKLQDGSFLLSYTDVMYGQHLIQVQGCLADGLTCCLGDVVRVAPLGEYDVVNRLVLSEKPAEVGYDGTVIPIVVYPVNELME